MKATGLDGGIYDYIARHTTPEDEILRDLRQETEERFSDLARMQISHDQGMFLQILVAALGALNVLEIGTFTGYSSICMARGLPKEGRLLTLDNSTEYTDVARRYWARAALDDRIELAIAPALETLRGLPREPLFDFAFVDAAKTEYRSYYQEILPRLRKRGLIAVDNVLWEGKIVDPDEDDRDTRAIREFNDSVVADDRVESVMIAVADGLTLIRSL